MQAVMTKVLSFVCYTTYFYINVVLSLGSTKIKLNEAMMITDNETAVDFVESEKEAVKKNNNIPSKHHLN